jgi:hypothetical protein
MSLGTLFLASGTLWEKKIFLVSSLATSRIFRVSVHLVVLLLSTILNHCSFCEICGYKKGMTPIFFHPSLLLLLLDPGSGMGKNQNPGYGINIPDPQYCLGASGFIRFCHHTLKR